MTRQNIDLTKCQVHLQLAISAGMFTISTGGEGWSLVAPMASNVFARAPMMGGGKDL